MRNPDSANTRKGHGRQVSFIIDKGQRASNYTDWMKRRVDSDRGKQIYSHRMSVVEPVFGNIGTNKRLNRFSLRGKKKVQGQWQLYCLIHNLEKLKNYGELAAIRQDIHLKYIIGQGKVGKTKLNIKYRTVVYQSRQWVILQPR